MAIGEGVRVAMGLVVREDVAEGVALAEATCGVVVCVERGVGVLVGVGVGAVIRGAGLPSSTMLAPRIGV
ncbi:MAG: hypothetical protein EXR68_01145 [Dehalococcoidia bacterium]|nr:hypothetical protein [Dehalococcoidia bacterium]